MKTAAILALLASSLAGCFSPFSACTDVAGPDGPVEVCERRRECRNLYSGKFVPCPPPGFR